MGSSVEFLRMSTSIFLQGMSGDPLSLPPEYQDLVRHMNVESHLEAGLAEDSGSEDESYLSSLVTFLFSPVTFLIYLMDTWVEDRVKKIIKKTSHLRAKYYR